MQNKANLIKVKNNATFFSTKDYENEPRRRLWGKQSQTKPITDNRRQTTENGGQKFTRQTSASSVEPW